MVLYEYEHVTVRLLTEADAQLLLKWLTDPQVLEYYDGRDHPHDEKLVHKHFYERTMDITQCVVQFNGVDIGYIQYYPISADEIIEYGYANFEGKIFGMDQFIGEVDYWNKGIGTALVQSMVQYLTHHEQVDKIVLDPQTWNARAIRVYEKCRFRKIKLLPKHEWHEGQLRDSWLMEYFS